MKVVMREYHRERCLIGPSSGWNSNGLMAPSRLIDSILGTISISIMSKQKLHCFMDQISTSAALAFEDRDFFLSLQKGIRLLALK